MNVVLPDFTFSESLGLVIIPIVIGSISTYFISHSWQRYRYKIEIKKELLEMFHKYIQATHYSGELFVRRYLDKYDSDEDLQGLLETGNIIHKIKLPTSPDELPIKILSKEYEDFFNMMYQGYDHRTKLITSLRLYSNSPELVNEIEKIARNNGYHFSLIRKIMKSMNPDEITKLHEEAFKKYIETEELCKVFEEKLVNLKIRKIPT